LQPKRGSLLVKLFDLKFLYSSATRILLMPRMDPNQVRQRPPAIPIHKTYVYSSPGGTPLPIDIYVPSKSTKSHTLLCPIMLYIHGGAWIAGSRSDYSQCLFDAFLSRGYVVASPDYRFLPESSIHDQFDDAADVGIWLKDKFPSIVREDGFEVNQNKIVVDGASAGALIALSTVNTVPRVLLKLTSITGMHMGPYSTRYRVAVWPNRYEQSRVSRNSSVFERPSTIRRAILEEDVKF
jgi:hypothetical protein